LDSQISILLAKQQTVIAGKLVG